MLLPDALAQKVGSLNSGVHTQVCQDQAFFQLIVEIVIDLRKAGEYAAQRIGQGLSGLGEACFDLIKKSHNGSLLHFLL